LGLVAIRPRAEVDQELVERAKANPGQINYGSFGIATDPSAGACCCRSPPTSDDARAHRGQTPEITDILSGNSARVHHHGRRDGTRGGGKAQSPGHVRRRARRSSSPHTDADRSRYPESSRGGWAGLLAPAGTPPQIVNKLYAGMAKALAMPDVKRHSAPGLQGV